METKYFHFYEVLYGTEDYNDYQKARYAVFCEELGRVEFKDHVNEQNEPIESDHFDGYSRHFIARHKNSGIVAGFVRVILPNPIGLNVRSRYVIDQSLPYGITLDNIGEISRLAIMPEFRGRRSDAGKPVQGDPKTEMLGTSDGAREHQPELVLGLYREVYSLCQHLGIQYCVAAMESRYSRLLNTLGFPFLAIGPINDSVSPPRRVYLVSASEMEKSLSSRENSILQFMQGVEKVR